VGNSAGDTLGVRLSCRESLRITLGSAYESQDPRLCVYYRGIILPVSLCGLSVRLLLPFLRFCINENSLVVSWLSFLLFLI
jgi:hypothetical protein